MKSERMQNTIHPDRFKVTEREVRYGRHVYTGTYEPDCTPEEIRKALGECTYLGGSFAEFANGRFVYSRYTS